MKSQAHCVMGLHDASCMCSGRSHLKTVFLDLTINPPRCLSRVQAFPLVLVFSLSLSGLFYPALQLFLKAQLKSQGYKSQSVPAELRAHTHTHTQRAVFCARVRRERYTLTVFSLRAGSVCLFFKRGVTVNICYLCQCNIYTPLKCDVYAGWVLCQLSLYVCFIFGVFSLFIEIPWAVLIA